MAERIPQTNSLEAMHNTEKQGYRSYRPRVESKEQPEKKADRERDTSEFSKLAAAIAQDGSGVRYRKELNTVTGSVLATIFFQRVLHWTYYWSGTGESFYKFNAPCKHELYKEGDSWQEELGFTKDELITARRKVATKIKRGVSKEKVLQGNTARELVLYWTDSGGVTHYMLNVRLYNKMMDELY